MDALLENFSDVVGQMFLLWQRLRRDILDKEGLAPTDKRILFGLLRTGEISKKELAKIIVLEHSSLTRSLDRLEKTGDIVRVTSSDDKRYIKLSLTSKGLVKVKKIRRMFLQQLKLLFPKIADDELKKCIGLFEEIKKSMQNKLDEINK